MPSIIMNLGSTLSVSKPFGRPGTEEKRPFSVHGNCDGQRGWSAGSESLSGDTACLSHLPVTRAGYKRAGHCHQSELGVGDAPDDVDAEGLLMMRREGWQVIWCMANLSER
jgi:hypothetical protein